MDDIIKIINLNKDFDGSPILKNLNFSIKRGSITGIIGKSGAGKTTLLRCMNFLEKPESGQIIINDHDILNTNIENLKKLRQKIGMIFQSFNLLSRRNVMENIALPLEITNLTRSEINAKAKIIASLVGLEDKLLKYPSSLSGGQKQRVAVARALVSEADILLCDEFTSALDPETTLDILGLLRDINIKLGVTVILITHDMSVIREICDYVYVIDSGSIIEMGDVEQIFYNPRHDIVKSLISSMFAKEIPNSLKERLINVPIKDCEVLVRLIFSSSSTQRPIISELIHEYKITINIISGRMDHLRNLTLGNLLITFKYDELLYLKVESYLNEHMVHPEILGYLKGQI